MDPSRLGVIARTSAMQFKKTSKRADEISVDLGVSHLLEGSIRTTGSRIRIAVQLIETQHESHVWAELYERDAKDVVTLQRDVAEAIVRQVTTSLAVASSDSIASRRHSTSAEAYQNYLRGRYYWSKDTADRLQKAMEHFHRAIELDPSYALAYSGVADTYILLGSDGFLPMSEAYPLARTAAPKALELDDKVGEAHMSMAAVSADYDWDWPEADRHYKRAVALNPNDVTALRSYSFYLACMGRLQESLDFAERARRVDPVSADAQMNLGIILYFARRYDDAVAAVTETFELAPDFGPAHVLLAESMWRKACPNGRSRNWSAPRGCWVVGRTC
jgi:tetratricopeptide (TPR) repeat protein